MLPFTSRKNPVIGIDISSTSVKVLELSHSGSGYRVEHYGVEPLPANCITEKVISDVEAVGDSIRKLLKQTGTKAKKCTLTVAGSAVITKVITMPSSLSDSDMEGQIQIEADQYIPYALEEVNLDFNVLGPTEGNPETVDVLLAASRSVLAASRSENVDMRVAAAEVAGLNPVVVGGNLNLLEPLTAGDPIPLSDTLNVNLPVPERDGGGVAGGQLALSFIKLPFGYALNLEFSAAQLESRAEVISNPRVITANQSTASIESGTEIPYVSQTFSGATDVEFKKAVLALEVTPQITPDDRINMEVNVKNDSVGQVFQGIPSIDTNEITSNVLVNNGQTVVLGGIYTEESSGSITKVPFFGDSPFAGRLFRNDTETSNKSELQIFITPKIIDEQLNLTR